MMLEPISKPPLLVSLYQNYHLIQLLSNKKWIDIIAPSKWNMVHLILLVFICKEGI